MKNIRTAVIAGVIAIAAIAAAIIIIVSGNAKNGLYITAVSGDVSVSNSDNGTSEAVSAEQKLSQGDIITVSEGGSATLTYRTGDVGCHLSAEGPGSTCHRRSGGIGHLPAGKPHRDGRLRGVLSEIYRI